MRQVPDEPVHEQHVAAAQPRIHERRQRVVARRPYVGDPPPPCQRRQFVRAGRYQQRPDRFGVVLQRHDHEQPAQRRADRTRRAVVPVGQFVPELGVAVGAGAPRRHPEDGERREAHVVPQQLGGRGDDVRVIDDLTDVGEAQAVLGQNVSPGSGVPGAAALMRRAATAQVAMGLELGARGVGHAVRFVGGQQTANHHEAVIAKTADVGLAERTHGRNDVTVPLPWAARRRMLSADRITRDRCAIRSTR